MLYWRNALRVVELLFSNPVFATCMEYTPYRLLDEDTKPVLGEFMSGQFAWEYQVRQNFASSNSLFNIFW